MNVNNNSLFAFALDNSSKNTQNNTCFVFPEIFKDKCRQNFTYFNSDDKNLILKFQKAHECIPSVEKVNKNSLGLKLAKMLEKIEQKIKTEKKHINNQSSNEFTFTNPQNSNKTTNKAIMSNSNSIKSIIPFESSHNFNVNLNDKSIILSPLSFINNFGKSKIKTETCSFFDNLKLQLNSHNSSSAQEDHQVSPNFLYNYNYNNFQIYVSPIIDKISIFNVRENTKANYSVGVENNANISWKNSAKNENYFLNSTSKYFHIQKRIRKKMYKHGEIKFKLDFKNVGKEDIKLFTKDIESENEDINLNENEYKEFNKFLAQKNKNNLHYDFGNKPTDNLETHCNRYFKALAKLDESQPGNTLKKILAEKKALEILIEELYILIRNLKVVKNSQNNNSNMKIEDKEFICPICAKKLKSYQALGGHMLQMHKKKKNA